ncbi:tRNA (adenosine(37)-N6)-threonylcarbamoyltransferase complex transferase subunit TsaD [Buchnera aphidicola]|uniref:tRNA (adenosine(37)-N6)-threonylcarbamoyltransferase complex transferase subunit TsaD n=1 Tax=Buchnera aphidicola TaxID=9 RepID=UPI00107D5C7D|nr:tRNA (adenosine(37)-N6)-threonylcarbamoyltransferase complex transferase subunit TsaD [Buchnera aphidicola]VFP79052.1 tRNA N6-adenosine threonylcarbamoyltransferase [Buchnera aphidicola (Cinara curtihirsuta)]
MRILGIETSCDDTSVAIYDQKIGLVFHSTLNQNKVHAEFSGIVPELAARSHLNQLIFLIKKIFSQHFTDKNFITKKNIFDAIAYTIGPGFSGSLLVGSTIALSLSLSLNIPSISVNHLEGHLLSVMLNHTNNIFPFLALLVSGANTQLISSHKFGQYTILGETLDDSVGNVFDYIAKLLGLGYPGGKKLSDLAKHGQSGKYFFPRPMTKYSNLNFSFSGLKTHVKNIILNNPNLLQERFNIAKSFEEAIVDTLVVKCKLAIQKTNLKNLLVCGGVSSNHLLRKKLKNLVESNQGKCFFPKKIFCTDNAAMIAYVGFLKYNSNIYSCHNSIRVFPDLLINDKID